AAEPVVDHRRVDTGPLGDAADGGALVAAFGELGPGRVEQLRAGVRTAPTAPPPALRSGGGHRTILAPGAETGAGTLVPMTVTTASLLGAVTPSRTEFRELAALHRVIPVTRRLLADDETPVGVYRKLAGERAGTFLLESAEDG